MNQTTQRRRRLFLICIGLVGSWLGMQWVHEGGHAFAAVHSGGRVERIVLHPLSISRTDLSVNPHPLLVVWAGPFLGTIAPVLAWLVARAFHRPSAFLFRFFAGFCCLANGAYLGFGSFDGVGDCGDLLRHDAPIWELWLFGIVQMALGLALWHGLGASFGLGPAPREITRAQCLVVGLLTVGMAVAGLAVLA